MKYFSTVGRSKMPFQFYIGGRGIGKTYSALADAKEPIEPNPFLENETFIYLRRTETEIEGIANDKKNPFKRLNKDKGWHVDVNYSTKEQIGTFFTQDEEERKVHGYLCALSTMSNLRGADFYDVTSIVFEEFIPEIHKSYMRGEALAFLHAYETINRNRELDGEPPVMVKFLANSIMLANPILIELGLVSIIQTMLLSNQLRYTNKARGLYIELILQNEVSTAKSKTALYNLVGDGKFKRQAISNEFTEDPLYLVKKVPYIEYKPLITYDEYTIYKHKSNGMLHIALKKEATKQEFIADEIDKFRARFSPIYRNALIDHTITFDNYQTKLVFDILMTKRK